MTTVEKKIPKRVFIVPYRNRVQHKFFFCKYMSFILEDHHKTLTDSEIDDTMNRLIIAFQDKMNAEVRK